VAKIGAGRGMSFASFLRFWAVAGKAATTTTPIVFETGADPVEAGLVASLNRPGGNVTGVTNFSAELAAKVFELTHELVPNATVVAVLVNPTSPNRAESDAKHMQAAGRALGQAVHILNASTEGEIDAAFASSAQLRAGALTITGDPFFQSRRNQIVALAVRHAVPLIYGGSGRDFVAAGGLMSYGSSLISCSHIGPKGGSLGFGRQAGGTKPAGRTRMSGY
jgi:putative tryptophan/tyrosine transport system substrate-binding protein